MAEILVVRSATRWLRLNGLALLAGTALTPLVPLKLMDRRPFRPPDDVERDRLVGLAAKALHLEVLIPGVERVTEGPGRLGRSLEGEHPGVPRLAGSASRRVIGATLGQMPDRRTEHVLGRLGSHSQ